MDINNNNQDQLKRIIGDVIRDYFPEVTTPATAANASSSTAVSRAAAERQAPPVPQSASTSFSIPKTARVAMLTAKRTIEMREYPIREIGDDEMLIRVEGCGICGTDVHEYKADPFGYIPIVLGHEGTGEIVKLGKNVHRDNAGKIVHLGDKIVTSVTTCGQCEACLYMPGRLNLCQNLIVQGLIKDDDTHLNGYFADYMIVRSGASFFIVNDMSLDLRMLIEPAAVVVHALERAKSTGLINFRSRVLIQGCGPIGLLMLAAVRAAGVQHILALDGDDNRLDMAHKLGADHLINYKNYAGLQELTGAIKENTHGLGAHFAFQCTGVPTAASNIWKYVRRGGGICELGFFVDNGTCSINPHFDICSKEITLVGSWVYNIQEYPIAYNFLRRAQGIGLPVEKLITHRFPLEKIQEALETNIRLEGLKVAWVA